MRCSGLHAYAGRGKGLLLVAKGARLAHARTLR
jgi:hypothetical protein